jgi:hypothetical protein
LTGVVAKGRVAGATVKLFTMNSDGTRGAALGTSTTDASGAFTMVLEVSGPTLVEATGGAYVNEVTGTSEALSGTDLLTAVLPAGTTRLAVTPLTHMAATRARVLAAGGTPLATAIDAANAGVAQQFALVDILGTIPVDAGNATQVATSSREQRSYGIVLAGMAQEAANLGVRPMALAAALATDLEDGVLDGLGSNPIEVPTITGAVITLPKDAGTGALQNAINTFLASGHNLTNLAGLSISTEPVNINPAGGSFFIEATALPAAIEGSAYSATLTARGGTPDYKWTVTAGSALPSWLSLDSKGILAGLPPSLSLGSTMNISPPFSVTCSDAKGMAQAINWTITIVKAGPTLTPVNGTLTVNQPGTTQVATASGGTPPYYFFSDTFASGAPPLGTVVGVDGNLKGTAAQQGVYAFGVCVADLVGAADCRPTSVTCNAGQTGSSCWYDSTSNLSWEVTPSGGSETWQSAVDSCAALSLCGHDDWRLPTISELRSLIRGCAATQTGGTCGVTDTCLSIDCLSKVICNGCSPDGGPNNGCHWPAEIEGECNWSWSSSSVANYTDLAWRVDFALGGVRDYGEMNALDARCVRDGP